MSDNNKQEKVARLGVVREPGFMYFIKGGSVWRQPQPKQPGLAPELVAEAGVVAELGYIYFLDPEGDVARTMTSGKREELAETAGGAPTTFAEAFAPLRARVGQPVFLQIGPGSRLAEGRHPITIFDWTALDADARATFIESQVYELTMSKGAAWADRQVPFALVGGESHPIALDELDQQTDGVLLIDLASGMVVLCADASTTKPRVIAKSTAALAIVS